MKKFMAVLLALATVCSMAACGAEEKETTLTGMVVSVDGTKISVVEMDTSSMGDFAAGERPQMPEDMEGFEGFKGFENFSPEEIPEGMMPQDGSFPQWGEGEMPQMPEGMTMPNFDGEMPNFGGENGGMRPDFGSFTSDAETTEVDIGSAHISVEIDDGKESGSMDDIKVGTFVTITMNGKGKATYVLISSQRGFGGGRRGTN